MPSREVIAKNVATVATQIGGTMLPDSDQWFNRFQVRSETSSRLYVIAQRTSDKTWGCSCPGWRHYRRCKHLTDVLGRLANVPLIETFDAETIIMLRSAQAAHKVDLEPSKVMATPVLKGRVLDL